MINIGVFNINTIITTKLIYSICDYSRNASLEVMVYTDNKDVQIVGHNNVHKITDYNNNIFDCVVCHNVYALSFKNKPEQIISTKDISYKKILNEFLEKNTPNRLPVFGVGFRIGCGTFFQNDHPGVRPCHHAKGS